MKLYVDEDLSDKVAELLRQRGLDATGAREVGRGGRSDIEQLRFAAREDRCLVTRNVEDFVGIAHELVNRQEPHAGVILVPKSFRGDEFSELAEAIARCVAEHPRGLADQVVYLARQRSRGEDRRG